MHGINWRSRNPIEISGPENSALCQADRTAQSIRRRSENTYAIDLRDATLVVRHVIIFGYGHGLQRAIIDESQHRTPERLIMAQH